MPILDNSTRWNSMYASIQRAIVLKRRIQLFCVNHEKEVGKDLLSSEDWNSLEELADALKPFHQATLRAQGLARHGHHGAVWEALPIMETLLSLIEKKQELLAKTQGNKAPRPIQVAYQNAWEKLRKYYSMTDNNHGIYAAAILLHPTHRKHYFEKKWNTTELAEWKEPLYQHVREIWEAEYKHHYGQEALPDPIEIDEIDPFDAYLADTHAPVEGDCFSSFISSPATVIDRDSILTWWNEPTNPWRPMRQMAFDLFSIPAMSAEIEREFSSAKQLITLNRNRLSDDTIEELELLRNWWRQDIGIQRS
jgi:hAT family C-terminal dimerisation region